MLVSLYVDKRKNLLEDEVYESPITGKMVQTIDNKWNDLQLKKFNSISQPLYVLLNSKEQQVIEERNEQHFMSHGTVKGFSQWLASGLKAYHS